MPHPLTSAAWYEGAVHDQLFEDRFLQSAAHLHQKLQKLNDQNFIQYVLMHDNPLNMNSLYPEYAPHQKALVFEKVAMKKKDRIIIHNCFLFDYYVLQPLQKG